MSIAQRVKNIILKPADEWNVIAAEPATIGGLFTRYAMPLALIPALMGLGAALLMNTFLSEFMGSVAAEFTLSSLMTQTVIAYVLGLVLLIAMAYLIKAISPSFNGRHELIQATKLIVYAGTPSWVFAIFLIIPFLGVLVYFGGMAYSVYLIYLGLHPVLGVPKEKVAGMTVVVILTYLVGSVVFYIIQQSLTGLGMASSTLSGA
jgi:hypothetical protein